MRKRPKKLIAFLLMLAVVISGSSFAYWASYVDGTENTSYSVLQVGQAESTKSVLTITPNQLNSYGILVPKGQKVNSIDPMSVEEMNVIHELVWDEDNEVLQTTGNIITGYIGYDISVEIIPNNEELVLDQYLYRDVYNLIQVTPNESNPNDIILNEKDIKVMNYKITLDEPKSVEDYELISNSTIHITFLYRVRLYDLSELNQDVSINFMNISKEELLEYNPETANIDKWSTEVGTPLNHQLYSREQSLFIPITSDEYTLTVQAKLNNTTYMNGGYGIFFDTTLDSSMRDTGQVFQFDRGYTSGAMIVRERLNGQETRPTFFKDNSTDIFPSKYEDPEWWTDTHEITINVVNIDNNTRMATFYIDGTYLGSITYEDIITDETVYVGFRGWSSSPTTYYSLHVK